MATVHFAGGRLLAAEEEGDWLAVPVVRHSINSSNLASIGYQRDVRVLEVEFHSGSVYRYRAVPEEIYDALRKAESKGRYFGQAIRGRYQFRRLKDAVR